MKGLFLLQILANSKSGSSFLIAQCRESRDLQFLLDEGFATYQVEDNMQVIQITEKGRQEVFIDSI